MDPPKDPLPERSSAWGTDGQEPSQEMIDRAVTATMNHPLGLEARSHFYCHAIVMVQSPSLLDGCRLELGVLARIKTALGDSESVVLVSYHTSTVRPEPLAGGGESFNFVLHPANLEVLYGGKGSWRS